MFYRGPTILREPHVCFHHQNTLSFSLEYVDTMQTEKQTQNVTSLLSLSSLRVAVLKEESNSKLYKSHPFGRNFPVSKTPGRKCHIKHNKCLSLWNRGFQFLNYLSSTASRFRSSKVGRQLHLYEHVPDGWASRCRAQVELKLLANVNF